MGSSRQWDFSILELKTQYQKAQPSPVRRMQNRTRRENITENITDIKDIEDALYSIWRIED